MTKSKQFQHSNQILIHSKKQVNYWGQATTTNNKNNYTKAEAVENYSSSNSGFGPIQYFT